MEMSLFHKNRVNVRTKRVLLYGVLIATATLVAGCQRKNVLNFGQTYNAGYVIDQNALNSVKIGSSREQVMLALGSPSLQEVYDGEIYYYISQKSYKRFQFMKPSIVDRKVLAIYFNKDGTVSKIARYGLKDGKLFDFVSQTTPTAVPHQTFLMELIRTTRLLPVPSISTDNK
ncbi:outer membrane protein assembly factor BamE [Bartonella sp. DGB2]|uniref:outer membrane protein assembly factor BamE n=1 Tax=Bartonella sp. DGB2 TaxID=3388426 RepID=UPI00398FDAFE